eukprot:TRINITY_DN15039_c0_g1_i7.p1 TRINITY_DN15039_c0_g1~~TRINITY_DN15039_c0_g1_i7.p1  ORF type:complete len:248 (+),score=45.75 TRINITY_DN15039_c0_g1_i7:71-814(+)
MSIFADGLCATGVLFELKVYCVFFFFQAEDGIRDVERSRGLGDVYKRQTYQHPKGFDLKKTTGHKKQLFSSTLTNIQYSPKTTLINERIGRGIVLFSKMPKRNFDFGLNFNKFHDSVDRKTLDKFYANPQRSVPNFQRQRTTMDKDNSLPRFLQGIHNRMGVGILSPQSLKANNYQNARFLSNTSSFSNLSKKPTSMRTMKRKKKFEDDLEISQSLDDSSCVMVDMKEEEETRQIHDTNFILSLIHI